MAANKGAEDYDPNVAKRKLSDVLRQLNEAGLKGELGFEFSESVFWKELEELVARWFTCMSPVMGLTFRQAAKAARSAALSRRKQSLGVRAFMAAQRAKNNPDVKPAEAPSAIAAEGRAAEKTSVEEYSDYLRKNRTAQVCGFDVMMDSAGKLHLLEVNNTPSLSTEEIVPAHGGSVDEEGGGYVCTETGCEYNDAWEEGTSHIHREGAIDVAIKEEVVTGLFSLITESHEMYTGGSVATSAARREVNGGRITEPAATENMSLLQAAYCNLGFLDSDDLGAAGWASSALLAFSQLVQFTVPQKFRNALLSAELCTAGAEADLEAMIAQWTERMTKWYQDSERRSSSARLEVGEFVRFLDEAIGKGILRVDLGGVPAVLRALAAFVEPTSKEGTTD